MRFAVIVSWPDDPNEVDRNDVGALVQPSGSQPQSAKPAKNEADKTK